MLLQERTHMSVLIEALTLVVRRSSLEQALANGADVIRERLDSGEIGARWVTADDHLVAASFLPEQLPDALQLLMSLGLTVVDDERYVDIAIVDHLLGLNWDCEWLEWQPPHAGRYSVAWLAGTEPGDLAIPSGHTPGQDPLFRPDPSREPGLMRLSSDPSGEYWLNTATGAIERHAIIDRRAAPGPIMQAVISGLESLGVDHELSDPEQVTAGLPCGLFDCELRIRTYESQDFVEAVLFVPMRVPAAARATTLKRWQRLGMWWLDLETGRPGARIDIDVRDAISPYALGELLTDLRRSAIELQHELLELAWDWLPADADADIDAVLSDDDPASV
jgi:hypothetical protein